VPNTGQNRVRLPGIVLQIDREPSDIGRLFPVTQGMVAGARFALDDLLAALQDEPGEHPSRAEEVARVRGSLVEYVWQKYGNNVAFLEAVRKAVPRDGVIVADMTKLGYASAEYLPFHEPRTFIHPSELCSIGCGLPLALGAKVAAPQKPVVALCGDGGFLLNMGELATAAQEQLDVVTVLFNDATYTAVKQQQARRFHRRYIATDLQAPDYVLMAQSFGIASERVTTPAALQDALTQAIQRDGPSLIEVTLPPVEW
jgi:acetolactate synthase-1/2/3 large subunit